MSWVVSAVATAFGVSGATVVGTSIALAGLGLSVKGANAAEDAAENRERAAAKEIERDKKLQLEQNEKLLSTARARAAASGTSGASEALFLQDLKETGLEELDWLATVGQFKTETAEIETSLAKTKGRADITDSAFDFVKVGSSLDFDFGFGPSGATSGRK